MNCLTKFFPASSRFLDLLIGRHDAGYRSDLLEFTRIRRQRNQLLLLIKQRRVSEDELDVWDIKMADVGARIVAKRVEAIKAIQSCVAEKYALLAENHNGNVLKIIYEPSLGQTFERDYLGNGRGCKKRCICVVQSYHKSIHIS